MNYTTKILTLAAVISCYSTSFSATTSSTCNGSNAMAKCTDSLNKFTRTLQELKSKMQDFETSKATTAYRDKSAKQKAAHDALMAAPKKIQEELKNNPTPEKKAQLNAHLAAIKAGTSAEDIELKTANTELSDLEGEKKKNIWKLEEQAKDFAKELQTHGGTPEPIPHQT